MIAESSFKGTPADRGDSRPDQPRAVLETPGETVNTAAFAAGKATVATAT